jgi:hypothetical protein
MGVLIRRLPSKDLRTNLREVGRTAAQEHHARFDGKTRDQRIEVAVDVLKGLGGDATFQEVEGVGSGVSPRAALEIGLVNLDDPAVTLELLRRNALVGLTGFFGARPGLRSLGMQCSVCHATVDKGTFFDPRLNDPVQFPVAARNGFGNVRPPPGMLDLITAKLQVLHLYQLALSAPVPPDGSFDRNAALRGKQIFVNDCATCHVPPLFASASGPQKPRWLRLPPAVKSVAEDQFFRNTAANAPS